MAADWAQIVLGVAAAAAIAAVIYLIVLKSRRKGKTTTVSAPVAGTSNTLTTPLPPPTMAQQNTVPVSYSGEQTEPGAIDYDLIRGRKWAPAGGDLSDMYGFFKPGDETAEDGGVSITKAQEQIKAGLRKAFDGEGDGLKVPKLDGSKWAKANERIMAIRDGAGNRRRARLTGINNDLRGNAPRPAGGNINRLRLFDISEAFANFDGVQLPGADDTTFANLVDAEA